MEKTKETYVSAFNINNELFYRVIFRKLFSETDVWNFVFALEYTKSSKEKFRRPVDDVFGNTGTGNQIQVFSTVVDIVKNFIKMQKPYMLKFSGTKIEKRDHLYSIMIKKFEPMLKSLGYTHDRIDHNLIVKFVIKKIK